MDATKEVLKQAIETYGEERQLCKAIEELGELIRAIGRYESTDGSDAEKTEDGFDKDLDNIAEEIADVRIMLRQLCMIYRIGKRTRLWEEHKIARLAQRLRHAEQP